MQTRKFPRGGVHLMHAAIAHHTMHTSSGAPPLTITSALPRKPKSITIYGNTVDGAGVGDRTSNLFYPTQGSFTQYGITMTVTGNIITLNGTLNSDTAVWPFFKLSNAFDSYTGTPRSGHAWFSESVGLPSSTYSFKKHYISGSTSVYSSGSITIPSVRVGYNKSSIIYAEDAQADVGAQFTGTPKFIALYLGDSASNITYYNYTFSLMFNYGSSCLDYEPYGYKIPLICSSTDTGESNRSVIYTSEPLHTGASCAVSKESMPTLYKGNNIISVDTAIQPSEISVIYDSYK